MQKNKKEEPQPNKSVPPQPQIVKCINHKDNVGKFVILPDQENPIIVCESCRIEDNYKELNYFVLNDVFNDLLEAYRKTDFGDCPMQYFAKYYLSQNFKLTEQDIDNQFDSFIENIVNIIEGVRANVKYRFQQFKDFENKNQYEFQNTKNEFQYEYNKFKEELSQWKDDNQSKFYTLHRFCEKLQQKVENGRDFDKHPIVELTRKLREEQKIFYNDKILGETNKKINLLIKNLENNYIGENSFTKSQIATNSFMLEVFKKIKQEGSQAHLIDQTQLLYKKVNEKYFQQIRNFKDQLENGASILLLETNSNQQIGLYYNGKFKQKSLLFNLNKQVILQASNQAQLQLPQPNAPQNNSCLFSIGNDLVITGNLKNCKSKLGDVFDVKGQNIADCEEFLANGSKFDILTFELFAINDPEVLKQTQQIQPTNPNQLVNSQFQNPLPSQNSSFPNMNNVRNTINGQFPPGFQPPK